MNPAAQNPLNPPLFEIPNPPDEFGQDGGKLYRCYDALADEIDGDMAKGLKEQLDGMLIFAGLFAGVNSAFLALTIPLLSADPADDTNALLTRNNAILVQLLTGRNDTVPTPPLLPSESFSPSCDIYTINALFALSLAFAMISSFLAVLGRQWLVYYRRRSGGGPDRQRWEQLKRSLGAERWRLEPILDDVLPSLLQIGLIIFCASLILYLRHLSPSVSILVGIPLYFGLAFFIVSALCTVWDRFCPFHSPLSHLLPWATRSLSWTLGFVRGSISSKIRSFRERPPVRVRSPLRWLERWFSQLNYNWLQSMVEFCRDRPLERTKDRAQQFARQIWLSTAPCLYCLYKGREEESLELLQAIALQRAICISDDPATVLHSTANILAITSPEAMERLWGEVTFRERFVELVRNSDIGMLWCRGHYTDPKDFTQCLRRLYRSAAAHITLISDGVWELHKDLSITLFDPNPTTILIPGPLLQDSSSNLIKGSIGAFVIASGLSGALKKKEYDGAFLDHLAACSDVLASRSDIWNLSLISYIILSFHNSLAGKFSVTDIQAIKGFFRRDWDNAITILDGTVMTLLEAQSMASLDCDRVLSNILLGLERIVAIDYWQVRPDRSIKYYFILLEISEAALPSLRLSNAAREAVKMLRASVAQVWQRRYLVDFQEIIDPEFGVFRSLKLYLRHKRNFDRPEVAYHEAIAVVETFGPILRQINKSVYIEEHSKDMRAVCKTFNALVDDIHKVSVQMKNKARRLRDPGERWCHWQEEPLSITRIAEDSTGIVLALPSNLAA